LGEWGMLCDGQRIASHVAPKALYRMGMIKNVRGLWAEIAKLAQLNPAVQEISRVFAHSERNSELQHAGSALPKNGFCFHLKPTDWDTYGERTYFCDRHRSSTSDLSPTRSATRISTEKRATGFPWPDRI
jgi:hypothetical protein